RGTIVGIERDHEGTAHHCHGAAVGEAIDRHPHRWTLPGAKGIDDLVWHPNARCRLPALPDGGSKLHLILLIPKCQSASRHPQNAQWDEWRRSFRAVHPLFDPEDDQSFDEVVRNGLSERESHRALGRSVWRDLLLEGLISRG